MSSETRACKVVINIDNRRPIKHRISTKNKNSHIITPKKLKKEKKLTFFL